MTHQECWGMPNLLVRAARGYNHSWPDLHYSTEVC